MSLRVRTVLDLEARVSCCLHKLIHCESKNVLNHITTCKRLFQDDVTPEIKLKTPNYVGGVELELINPREEEEER